MSLTLRRALTSIAAAAVASSALLTTGAVSHAATVPPWEPDGSSVGGLIFYDASGSVITGGNLTDDPIAGYVEGTTTIRTGDDKATLYGYLPQLNKVPGQWGGEIIGGPSAYDPFTTPAPSSISTTLPVYTGVESDDSLADLVSDYPNTDTTADGYAGLYQLRLETGATGTAGNVTYDSADILISGSGSTATWSIAYDDVQQSTTTSLKVTPTKATAGSPVSLTATVSPLSAAGSVKFLDGTKLLKTVPVKSGKASYTDSALASGTHKLSATFVPTDATAYTTSTSKTVSLSVKPQSTSVTLKASKSSIKKGAKLTLTAKETPSVPGKIAFLDSSKQLGTVTVKSGKASYSTKKLAAGTHKLKATFTPSNPADDSASTSKTITVKVKK